MNDTVKNELRRMFRRLRQSFDSYYGQEILELEGYILALEDTNTISERTGERLRKAMDVCCVRATYSELAEEGESDDD
jgi:hypothetical protein